MRVKVLILLCASCLAIPMLQGCRTAGGVRDGDVSPPLRRVAGRITLVDVEHGFVLMRAVLPPVEGVTAEVYRGREVVARLSLSGPRNYPHISAIILEGEPALNDVVVW